MEQTQHERINGTQRRALGRGLADILGMDQPQTESVTTAAAAYQIAAILEGVADRQVNNIFQFVQAIRQTSSGESVKEIGKKLDGIAAARDRREQKEKEYQKAKRFGWWKK